MSFNDPRIKLIDRGEWKHSWHLKTKNGLVDWENQENKECVSRELVSARLEAHKLMDLCEEVERYI